MRFTSRNDTTKEKKKMGDRDKGNSDERTTTDGNKPQGGSRGTGDRTNGNPNDGKRS
ncbi:hypothetical protein [Actinomadura geliboluensis]|uniref:hypothetical protein n=1 Tax=Actinomadura geliboluensis TaxID=882440 RepID=UPI0014872FE4|nr:hypothetical protein [Actinomadura geliboluensis]